MSADSVNDPEPSVVKRRRDHDELTHDAACDALELLANRFKTLLNSPKQDGILINQYADAMDKLHRIARQAATPPVLGTVAAGASTEVGAAANPGGTGRGVLVVPGLIADQEEWQRQMGVYEATRQ
jgi:hypothetical protein